MSQAPRHLIPIPPTRDPEHLVRVINQRLRDLQGLVTELTSARTQALDMGGQRVMNAGRAKVDTDLVTRKDLLDYAIFSPEGDAAIADKPLVARGGLRVPKKARMKDEVVTLEDLYNFLGIMQATGMLSGDVNGQFNNNVLNDTGVVPGTYGDSTHVPRFTVNSQGRLTNVILVPIAGGGGGAGAPLYETFLGPFASTTLSTAPTKALVLKNGVEQHDDGIGTAEGFFKLVATTLTIAAGTGDRVDVYEWGGTDDPLIETFIGPFSSTTLAITPTNATMVFKNGAQQHGDGVGTAEGTFAISGTMLTIAAAAGDRVDVYEWGAGNGPFYETFATPGSSVTLSIAPSMVVVFKNGVELHNDGIGTSEGTYKLVASTLTTPIGAGDMLDVYEWT